MNKIASVCIVSVLMLGTFACVPSQRGDVVSRSQARSPMVVHQATIIDLREVTIEGTPGLLGGIDRRRQRLAAGLRAATRAVWARQAPPRAVLLLAGTHR